MIGGDPDVSRALLDHGQDGPDHTAHRADLAPRGVDRGGHGVEVAEQFVGTVDQVHIHIAPIIGRLGVSFPSKRRC